MENLDERYIAAARYLKRIHSITRGQLDPADAIRMAIFIVYLHLTGKEESSLLSDPSYASTDKAKALVRAYEETRAVHSQSFRTQLDFKLFGETGFASLFDLAPEEDDRESMLLQLDYLVDALLDLNNREPTTKSIETFVASFAKSIIDKDVALIDLSSQSTGELGTKVNRGSSLWLPELTHGAEFEVLLKLEAHGRHVTRYSMSWPTLPAHSFYQFLGPRKDALVEELNHALLESSPGNSGLSMAAWFNTRTERGQAVTLLTVRDCRGVGLRQELRRRLIETGTVRAVIELPKRVARRPRQFLLVLGPSDPSPEQEIIFIDGRYCDVLRDEPLEKIAAFISVPLVARSINEIERNWPEWRNALGSELASRAATLFLGEEREARGLFRSVPIWDVLTSDSISIEPEIWIEPLDGGRTLSMLDPKPLHELLDAQKPCCAYVIGNNGAGKSFLMRGLVDTYVAQRRPVRAISSTASDRYPSSLKEHPNYRYMGARTTAAGTSTRLLAYQMLELLQVIHRDEHRVHVLDKASELVGFKGGHFVLPSGFKATSDSIAELKSIDELAYADLHKGDQPGFQRSESTVIVPFDHLSSGEQQILLLLVRVIAEAQEGTLFVVDEPETSLHVAWQRALPGVLSVVRDAFRVQFAIATHSPVLLSAAMGKGNYRFAARGGLIEPLSERASGVERLLFDAFGTYTESNREVRERCAEIVSSAIEQVNLGEEGALDYALSELSDMRHIVALSIPSLGEDRTAAHLQLIERAKLVLTGLSGEQVSLGEIE